VNTEDKTWIVLGLYDRKDVCVVVAFVANIGLRELSVIVVHRLHYERTAMRYKTQCSVQ